MADLTHNGSGPLSFELNGLNLRPVQHKASLPIPRGR
jgi:hypothetical protein